MSKPERHMSRWTAEEDKQVAEFIKERADIKTIAHAMGRSDASIRARIFQHVTEANINDIAEITKMTTAGVLYKIAKNTAEPWCADQDKWLVRHIQKNSVLDTAIRMKRTQTEILDRLEYIAKSYVTEAGFPLICAATITRFVPASRLIV